MYLAKCAVKEDVINFYRHCQRFIWLYDDLE